MIIQDGSGIVTSVCLADDLLKFYITWTEPGIPGRSGIDDGPLGYTANKLIHFKSFSMSKQDQYKTQYHAIWRYPEMGGGSQKSRKRYCLINPSLKQVASRIYEISPPPSIASGMPTGVG